MSGTKLVKNKAASGIAGVALLYSISKGGREVENTR